ncbi:arsenite efflux transporter metallochaperone ArsD [Nocardia asiatica]
MSAIEVFEPALCCNTGICGPEVDQALVTFSADLDWIRCQGGDITRHNLASEPLVFASNEPVRRFLELAGSDGLPLVLVDGVTVLTGCYPTRAQLASWAGIVGPGPVTAQGGVALLGLLEGDCSGPGCC